VRVAVTTTRRPDPCEEARAKESAGRHGLAFIPRGDSSLEAARSAASADGLLVLTNEASTLVLEGKAHRWFPGMAPLRVKWLRRHGTSPPATRRDPFLRACDFVEGDRVLDATLGLGADALVAAEAVGPSGEVWGLESVAALAAWVAEGLRRYADRAAPRVRVERADHGAFLEALPPRSFDVVLFDPMFRDARKAPGPFQVVRRLADFRPLDPQALAAARRVARRWVVVKDGAPGWDLARLGITPLASARGAHLYYARLPPAP